MRLNRRRSFDRNLPVATMILLATGLGWGCLGVAFPQAIPPAQRAVEHSSGEPVGQDLEEARRAFDHGEFEEAARLLRTALKRRPDHFQAAFLLVRALMLDNRLEEAQSAAESVPSSGQPGWGQLALAEVDFRMGRFDRAAVRYREAIRQDATLARAHFGLGLVLRAERRLRTAAGHLQKAFELDPHDPDIVLAWAGTKLSGETEALLEVFLSMDGYKRPGLQQSVEAYLKVDRALEGREAFQVVEPTKSRVLELSPLVDPAAKRRAFRNGQPMPVHGFALRVRFNGGKKRKLLLDTGANGVLLASKIARKDNVRPLAETVYGGVGERGLRNGFLGVAETMAIDDLEFRNCTIKLADKDHLPDGTDGIIGADVFSHFLIRLDFPERRIELTPNPDGDCAESCYEKDWIAQGEAAYLPRFRLIGGKILVDGTANGVPGQMLIDSGATLNYLSTRASEILGSDSSTPGAVRGISGSASRLRLLPEVMLELANVRQINRYMYAFDLSPISRALGVEIMGLAGNPMLKLLKVTLNYRTGWIKLEP